ncbi:MAG: bifunctional nuclease family protein, partial [Lentisphaerae bacterium]
MRSTVKNYVRAEVLPLNVILKQPTVLLKLVDREVYVPICVSHTAAHAIETAFNRAQPPPRPYPIQLCYEILTEGGFTFNYAQIYDLQDGIFLGRICLSDPAGEDRMVFESRASDAITLAIYFDAPIWIHQNVIEEAGISEENFLHFDEDDFKAHYI